MSNTSDMSNTVTGATLSAPGQLPLTSIPASDSYNGTLKASGYKPDATSGYTTDTVPVRIVGISYGLNIIADESHGANTKAFYARQVQSDTFNLQVQFVTSAERRAFYTWALGYAAAAVSPSTVGLMTATFNGVSDPAGNILYPGFSMAGVLASGMSESTTTTDVTWTMNLGFVGAQFTSGAAYVYDSQIYIPPSDTEAAQYFYPESSSLASNTPDALYASERSYLDPPKPPPAASAKPTVAPPPYLSGVITKLDHLMRML